MQAVCEAATDGVETRRGEPLGEITRSKDSDVAARALEILVPQSEVEMFARRGGNRHGDACPWLRDPGQFTNRTAIVVDVLHDFRTDDSVETLVGEGEMEGIPLEHGAHPILFFTTFAQVLRGRAHRVEIEIEPDDRRAARHGAEAMSSFAAAGIEEPMPRLDVKPLEIDGQQHESPPRRHRPVAPRPGPTEKRVQRAREPRAPYASSPPDRAGLPTSHPP